MSNNQGRALVASPYLTDPNFLRSVVYLLRDDSDGAMGLLLNRPQQATVGDLLEHFTEHEILNDRPVYYGGPVDGPLMMLRLSGESGAGLRSVALTSSQSHITDVCSIDELEPGEDYRVFDGYAGWGPQQLDNELRCGGWLLWDIHPDQIFSDPDDLWQAALKEIGRDILAGGIDPAKMPADPAFN